MIKKIIQTFLNIFDYQIIKIRKKKYRDFDQILKKILKKNNNIIFDIGANKGQSLYRYKKLFDKSNFYSFEPSVEAFKVLKSKYGNSNDVKLFNTALGSKKKKNYFMSTKKMNSAVLLKLIKSLRKQKKIYMLKLIRSTPFLKKII